MQRLWVQVLLSVGNKRKREKKTIGKIAQWESMRFIIVWLGVQIPFLLMTLDLILYRPELFMIFAFFVLLWAGTGNLVTPVAEILTITSMHTYKKKRLLFPDGKPEIQKQSKNEGFERTRFTPRAGPSQVSVPLTLWAMRWCILCFFCVYSLPLHSIFLGGSFQKDAYSIGASRILFRTRALIFRVSLSWQKVAGICQSEYVY
jgi:proton-translocating NADH-quinone oxidoreductase chain N